MHFIRSDIFHSARLKLTAFYFASLLALCVLLTFGVHEFTDHELRRGDTAQRGIAHQIFEEYLNQGDQNDNTNPLPGLPPGDRYFANNQAKQTNLTRQRLNRDYLIINLALLALGAVASYWFAGRTLRPIEEAHQEQKRFTSDASHELRTPLASMKLENEIFLRQKHFTETDARKLIASNLEEVDRLEKLATNLLSLDRYESTGFSHAPVPIEELVADALSPLHKKTGSTVKFTQSLEPAAVDVNRESITELLGILLDNAVKYGPKNATVDITGAFAGDAYVLSIRDRGHGIAEEDLPHIFERMYRGDKARSSKIPGHGIGLSLAQQIAKANQATLTAANAPDGGAVFTLTLR